jgi:hypothetical protein
MCADLPCPACRVMTDKIYRTRRVLSELHEGMDSADYSMLALPADAQLGYKLLAELITEIPSMSVLAPELNQIGESLRLHLEAFNQEIGHLEGLAP